MQDPHWLKGLERLDGKPLRCGLEVFGPQLRDLLAVVCGYPRIGFTIAGMGWPMALGAEGEAL